MQQVLEPLAHESFVQGDIIRIGAKGEPRLRFGFILTCDCDLAHDKFGDSISYLPIISLSEYITTIWARDRHHLAVATLNEAILDRVNDALIDIDPNAVRITLNDLSEPSELRESVRKLLGDEPKVEATLAALETLSTASSCLDGYMAYLKFKNGGKASAILKNEITNAISKRQFEYLYLNYLPRETEAGWIVLLRDIRSIKFANVFKRAADCPAGVGDEDQWAYRIGRLPDGIRFAVAQSFGALFSRIGMPLEFEEDRAIAFEATVATVMTLVNH